MHAHGQRWPTPPSIPAPQRHSFICNEIQATHSFADQQTFGCSLLDGIRKDTRRYLFGSAWPMSGFDAGFFMVGYAGLALLNEVERRDKLESNIGAA
jgi:hypothetical protein